MFFFTYEEEGAKTFLSGACQLKVDFLHSYAMAAQILGQVICFYYVLYNLS